MPKTNTSFQRVGVVDAEEVPNWTRRPPKYKEIIEDIEKLPVGKGVVYKFPNMKAASQARNTIRDHMNRLVATAVHEGRPSPIPGMVTTRLVDVGDGIEANFIMSPKEHVIQTTAERQASKTRRK